MIRARPPAPAVPIAIIDDGQEWWAVRQPGKTLEPPNGSVFSDTSPRPPALPVDLPSRPDDSAVAATTIVAATKPGAAKAGAWSTAVTNAAASVESAEVGVSVVGRLGRTSMIAGACAGFVSGCLAVALQTLVRDSVEPRFQAGLLVVFVGMLLGGLLASWQDLTAKSWGSAVRRFLVGALVVGAFGLLAVLLANAVFQGLADRGALVRPQVLGLVWAIVAAAIGLGLGVGVQRSPRAAVSGFLGGALGGFVGGLILRTTTALYVDPRGTVFVDYATIKGVLTVACTAAVIGWSIGLTERVTRRAWLTMIEGELRGREWTLDRRVAKVGMGYGADVRLPPLAGIEPLHVRVERASTGALLTPLAPTKVNGQPVDGATSVADGDVIEIGGCYMRYDARRPSRGS